ncbi:MAG: hypothetical protein KatS3mg115_1991 [Candidatus Poribacteria bacterium]|nr:MAG: hypothetical protein KatS3mg115_1991 [Candidatus Poribacteria bacterium]
MDPRGTLRTLLILLAVFVGLMIAYWRWGTPEEGSQERPSLATLYRFRPEAIQEIRISYADGRSAMAFRREATGWVLLEPVRAPALQEKVDELIELFRRPIRRRIPESDDSAFGLDRPTVRVELSLEDGTRRELLLGRKGVTFSLYLRERSDSGAVLVESWYLDRLTQPVEAFRERRLWSGSREQVARLVVHPPGEAPIVLERSSPAQVWRLLAVDDLADSERVEALLQLLSDVSILEFLEDNRSDFSAWTENRAVISLSLQTFGGAEERFLFWPEGRGAVGSPFRSGGRSIGLS